MNTKRITKELQKRLETFQGQFPWDCQKEKTDLENFLNSINSLDESLYLAFPCDIIEFTKEKTVWVFIAMLSYCCFVNDDEVCGMFTEKAACEFLGITENELKNSIAVLLDYSHHKDFQKIDFCCEDGVWFFCQNLLS